MRKAASSALGLALLLCGSPRAAELDSELFLAAVPLVDERKEARPAGAPIDYEVFVQEPAALVKAFSRRVKGLRRGDESVSFRLSRYPSERGKIKRKRYIESTFLADHEEPIFQVLEHRIVKKHGKRPGPRRIARFVHKYIGKKSYAYGQVPASTVADTQEGDCTEHAILLVAVLRMFKIPARFVTGAYVDAREGKVRAVGHAWAEYHHKGRWHGLDAARPDAQVDHHYLPIGTLEDEGPGYMMAMASGFQTTMIQKLVIR